jgi:hypothetical protein
MKSNISKIISKTIKKSTKSSSSTSNENELIIKKSKSTSSNPYYNEVLELKKTCPLWFTNNFFSNTLVNENDRMNEWLRIRILGKPLIEKYSWAIPDTRALNILKSYAVYSYSINSYYSLINGYKYKYITPYNNYNITYDNFLDNRHYKIKIIYELLLIENSKYIIWLDSDLIILNPYVTINNIISKYNNYDMIFSKDPNINNGLVNTGMFIIKNNKFSKLFFYKWWYNYNKYYGMDQHIFDLVYNSYNNINNHIVILESDYINSNFPAWLNQKSYNNILHLAGTNKIYKTNIFKLGYNNICNYIISNITLQNQIGLNRNILLYYYNNYFYDDNNYNNNVKINQDMNYYIDLKYELLDLLQIGYLGISNNNNNNNKNNNKKKNILIKLKLIYNELYKISLYDDGNNNILLYQETIDIGYNIITHEKNSNIINDILLEIKLILDKLIQYKSKIVYYYEYKYYEFLGINYINQNNYNNSIISLNKAISIWYNMINEYNYFGNGNGYYHKYKEGIELNYLIASIYCNDMNNNMNGLLYIDNIIELYDKYTTYNKNIIENFLDILLLSIKCSNNNKNYIKIYIKIMNIYLKQHNNNIDKKYLIYKSYKKKKK